LSCHSDAMSALNRSALNEYGDSVAWIGMVTAAISLVVVSVIGIVSKARMNSNTSRWVTVPFFCAISSAILSQIASMVLNTAQLISSNTLYVYSAVMTWLSLGELYVCLVLTFVVRLWLIFKDSAWRLSDPTRYALIVTCGLLQLSIFPVNVAMLLDDVGYYDIDYFALFFGFFILLYVTTSATAVLLFMRKLMKLSSITHCDQRQREKLMKQSTKYASLFLVGILSSLVAWISLHRNLRLPATLFSTADTVINVLCLYLQFGFAQSHYERLCGRADGCTRKIIESCNDNTQTDTKRTTCDI